MVPGADPLDTLLVVHRDGLGPGRVRLVDGVFWLADPADRRATDPIIAIPAVDPADGSRKAA
jgi:hypothetical protein